MALRSLVAKMRNPVAGSLLLSACRRRHPAPALAQGSRTVYRPKFNIETASREELLREADYIDAQIQEVWKRVCKEREKIPLVYADMEYTARLVIGFGILSKVITYVTSEDDDYYEDDPTAESQ